MALLRKLGKTLFSKKINKFSWEPQRVAIIGHESVPPRRAADPPPIVEKDYDFIEFDMFVF